jgi:hypothetical protein
MMQFFKNILLLAFMLTGSSAYAAGQIDLVEGNVNIMNKSGELRIPARGARVEAGDLITTGHDGEIQIITDDNGLLALRSNTSLKIEAYRAEGGQDDNVTMRLLRGSFRSITGWIGKIQPKNYVVHTASATLGIRGTDHVPLVVENGPEAGTYDKVNAGGTVLDTPFGKIEIGPGQAGFMPKDGTQPPKLLDKIPALYQPSRHEAAIEKTKEMLEQTTDEKLKEKQRGNAAKGAGTDGKPKIGDMEAGRRAAAALDEILRAYEMGNTNFIRSRLDPAMIGYQRLLDDIVVETNQCIQMRFNLLDTQIQAGPDLVVIQTDWEKRCLQMPTFTPRLDTGHTTFLMHLGTTGWAVSAISGLNPLAATGVLATISASTTMTCAAVNVLAVPPPHYWVLPPSAAAPAQTGPTAMPFTITVTDPDLANVPSITVRVSSGNDAETITLPASSAGVFQKTALLVSKTTASPGNGVIEILPTGAAGNAKCPAVTVSYVDTTTPNGTQIISASVAIP